MDSFDVIVIGGGNGGLSCALSLLKETKNVLLIEKNDYPGGVASSFKRGRFEFETALHELGDLGTPSEPGEVRKLFQNYGLDLTWIPVKDCFRLIAPYGEEILDVRMPIGRDKFIAAMEAAAPGSKKGMEQFFALADETRKALDYLDHAGNAPDSKKLREEFPNFLKSASYPVDTVLSALHLPRKAIAIVEAYWCYLGMDAKRLNFQHYLSMVSDIVDHGAYIPQGTSNAISQALLEAFEKQGGHVLFNTLAFHFLLDEKKRISGVMTNQGNFFSHHIVFNGSPHTVYERMIRADAIPEKALERAKARNFSGRPFVLYLGLNQSAESLGIQDYSVFLPETLDTAKAYEMATSFATLDSCVALCYNLIDPSFSPKDTCVMSFTQMSMEDLWGQIKVQDYYKKKDEVAEKILTLYKKKMGIDLHPFIEEIEIATPWTFARYNGAPEGAVFGYENENWDSLLNRIRAFPQEQEVAGLSFVGAFSFRGDGYSSAYINGAKVAKKVISDLRKGN